MSTVDLEKTLPLSEQIVRDAWIEFAGDARLANTVPDFVAWVREHQPEVLEKVSETVLAIIAEQLANG